MLVLLHLLVEGTRSPSSRTVAWPVQATRERMFGFPKNHYSTFVSGFVRNLLTSKINSSWNYNFRRYPKSERQENTMFLGRNFRDERNQHDFDFRGFEKSSGFVMLFSLQLCYPVLFFVSCNSHRTVLRGASAREIEFALASLSAAGVSFLPFFPSFRWGHTSSNRAKAWPWITCSRLFTPLWFPRSSSPPSPQCFVDLLLYRFSLLIFWFGVRSPLSLQEVNPWCRNAKYRVTRGPRFQSSDTST